MLADGAAHRLVLREDRIRFHTHRRREIERIARRRLGAHEHAVECPGEIHRGRARRTEHCSARADRIEQVHTQDLTMLHHGIGRLGERDRRRDADGGRTAHRECADGLCGLVERR